ncbi:MAG: CPBP family intramembrane glutamic endopeptidase [Candidatus Kapaibacterium sp.]|jgi:membrane protease YdiL (CAAX protease family)
METQNSTIKNEVIKFISFLKKPVSGFETSNKLVKFFAIFSLDLLITAIYILVFNFIEKIDFINQNLVPKGLNIDYDIVMIALLVVFIPIFEELIFRYFLVYKKYNPFNIFLKKNKSKFVNENMQEEESIDVNVQWNKILPKLYYISAVLFALIHLSNYRFNWAILAFFPILILVQFSFGLFTGYLRIKINFFSACLLHILHNGIIISFFLVFSGQNSFSQANHFDISKSQKEINIDMYEESYYLSIVEIPNTSNDVKECIGRYDEHNPNYLFLRFYNFSSKNLYEHFDELYQKKLITTNPIFLQDISSNKRYNIIYVKRNDEVINALDTVLKYVKENVK